MHNNDSTPQGVENGNIILRFKCVLTAFALHVNCISVVIKDRQCEVKVWKNVKVYFKWGWSKSPFDINSVVFHFDYFNYGRRSQPYFFSIATRLFFHIAYNKMKNIYITPSEQFQHSIEKS
jgi:hypothetical protein